MKFSISYNNLQFWISICQMAVTDDSNLMADNRNCIELLSAIIDSFNNTYFSILIE